MATLTLLCSAGFAALLSLLHGRFGKDYLRQWAWAWGALAAASGVDALTLPLETAGVASGLIAAAVTALTGLSSAFLLFGSYGLAWHLRIRSSLGRRLLAVLCGSLALLGALEPATTLTASTLTAVAAVSALASGVIVALRRARWTSPGIALFSLALIASGMVYAWRALLPATAPSPLAAFATEVIAGLLMIVALLDDEREGALLAASEIEHLAYNDSLTGLPNRSLFFDRLVVALAQATRQHRNVAVLFLDIDRFKMINDSLGHSVGDSLLRAAGTRIRDCIRPGDTLSRFGGDEFTVLLPVVDRVAEVAVVAQRILTALREPFHLAGRELVVTTSIGVSVYPSDGLDAETLVKHADVAMYRAKEQGRDNYQLYTPELNTTALERLDLENRLRKAIQNHELVVHYQPIIHIEKNTVHGFEALLRWNHPELGLLPPSQFIEAAEMAGLMIPIGGWVLGEACQAAARWYEKFGVYVAVSVNVSARQLHEPVLVEQVREALDATGIPPSLLDLEITESSAMRNADATLSVLTQLKKLGVRISMDDFGTGYSSLSYLRRFPVDTLKLDRSFVKDILRSEYGAISLAVIEMARALGMKVVAEGVETREQLAFLQKHLCDFAQGYLFAAPLSEEDCDQFIIRHTVPNMVTGPVPVQRLRYKGSDPAKAELSPSASPTPSVSVKTKSGTIRRSELSERYPTRPDWFSDN